MKGTVRVLRSGVGVVMRWSLSVFALAGLVGITGPLSAGCAIDASDTDSSNSGRADTYLGSIAGTDVQLAAVVSEDEWVLYTCGGPSTYDTHSFWLSGALNGERLAASKPGRSVTATLDDVTTIAGTLTVGDSNLPFVLSFAQPDGMSGLYAVVDEGCRTGAIVTAAADADEPLVQGTWCEGERFEQVTPAKPVALQDGYFVVTVPAMGERELWLERVTP